MMREARCGPAITRSIASSIARSSITLPLSRAVSRAASFITFARSAPVKPGVRLATCPKSTRRSIGLPAACTSRMRWRPFISGASTPIWRSKRPGRSRAGSSTSGRLVAAITITLELPSKPSISTSSWLRVCSRSSLPPPMPTPRRRPTASISSTKTIAAGLDFASLNRSRTRDAPTPTNISTKSEPEIE